MDGRDKAAPHLPWPQDRQGVAHEDRSKKRPVARDALPDSALEEVAMEIIRMRAQIREKALEQEIQQQPVVKGLGIRANKVQVVNESDCIKVRPKNWMDKKDWREIHDILRVKGFNWLADGKDSCWIMMSQK